MILDNLILKFILSMKNQKQPGTFCRRKTSWESVLATIHASLQVLVASHSCCSYFWGISLCLCSNLTTPQFRTCIILLVSSLSDSLFMSTLFSSDTQTTWRSTRINARWINLFSLSPEWTVETQWDSMYSAYWEQPHIYIHLSVTPKGSPSFLASCHLSLTSPPRARIPQ